MHKAIKNILENYYLYNYCDSDENDPVYNIFLQNDKYLKISRNKKRFWNFFDLLEIDYKVENTEIYIIKNFSEYKELEEGCKICSINNNNNVFHELLSEKSFYNVLFENNEKVRKNIGIKNPFIEEVQVVNGYKICGSILLLKLYDLNDLSFIDGLFNKISSVDYFILDLRDNQGGPFKNAIRLLEYFIPKGHIIVFLEDRISEYKITSKQNKKVIFENMIILFNKFTMSSAEVIIKSLVTEFPNTVLIGRSTGGKDIVTNVFSFDEYFIKVPQYKYKFNNYLDRSPNIESNFNFKNLSIAKFLKGVGLKSEKFD